MAKKVKCIECDNSMDWSIPQKGEMIIDKGLLHTLKNTIVCGYTMKTKSVNHCQYCEHYEHEGDFRRECRERYEKELNKLMENVNSEEKVNDTEKQKQSLENDER